MKTLLIALVALSLGPLLAVSQVASTQEPSRTGTASASATDADVQLFTKLVNEVGAAIEKQDMDALGKLMTPDYIHYDPNGGTVHKDDERAFIKTWPSTTFKTVGAVEVKRSGNMAVTVSRHAYGFTEDGVKESRNIQHTVVWILREGKWQMAVVQSKDIDLIGNNGPETAFKYKVWNSESNELVEADACYAPCIVYFDNESRDFDALAWDFGDTTLTGIEDPKHLFLQPGDHTIVLTASAGNKKNTFEKTLQVKAPPYANFEMGNNGCIAPCEVTFSNKSENAASYVWEFGNNAGRSDENNPEMQYQTPGIYQVKLTAANQDGLKRDTVKTVTIREDDSPFAQFSIKKNGPIGFTPRRITFQNSSKNADQYIWNFGDGSNGRTTANAPHAEHTYTNPGSYTVILIAKQNNRQSTVYNKFYVGPSEDRIFWQIPPQVLEQVYLNPALRRQWQDFRGIQR